MQKQGLGAESQLLTGLALIIGGKNTFGKTGDINPPDFEYEVVDEQITGIPKSPRLKFTVWDASAHFLDSIAKGEDFLLSGNIRAEDAVDAPLSMAIGHKLIKTKLVTKEGDRTGREFEIRVDTYIEKVNGEQTVKWNRKGVHLSYGSGDNLLKAFATNMGI